MLTRDVGGILVEKWTHNSGKMPWNQGYPSSDVAFRFLFRLGNLPIPHQLLFSGEAGWDSVPHGKLVAYKATFK